MGMYFETLYYLTIENVGVYSTSVALLRRAAERDT